jgi:hypothetical protein
MSEYIATDEVLVYLIDRTVNGSLEQKLAAKFILDCLRKFHTSEEIAGCINELEHHAIVAIAEDARSTASSLGLIR